MALTDNCQTGTPEQPLSVTSDLIQRYQSGEEHARDLLVELKWRPVRGLVRRFLTPDVRSLVESQDLVQDAFIRTLPHLKKFEPRGKGAFMGFMRTVVKNLILDHGRTLTRQPQSDQLLEDLPNPGPTVHEIAAANERAALVRAAVTRLPPMQRRVLLLWLRGYSHQEVATMVGKPTPDAAREERNRARKKLKQMLTKVATPAPARQM